jgi:hypothetical protein
MFSYFQFLIVLRFEFQALPRLSTCFTTAQHPQFNVFSFRFELITVRCNILMQCDNLVYFCFYCIQLFIHSGGRGGEWGLDCGVKEGSFCALTSYLKLFAFLLFPVCMLSRCELWSQVTLLMKETLFSLLFVCLFVLMVLGFEFRASCLLGRCSTAWVTPLAWNFALITCF